MDPFRVSENAEGFHWQSERKRHSLFFGRLIKRQIYVRIYIEEIKDTPIAAKKQKTGMKNGKKSRKNMKIPDREIDKLVKILLFSSRRMVRTGRTKLQNGVGEKCDQDQNDISEGLIWQIMRED